MSLKNRALQAMSGTDIGRRAVEDPHFRVMLGATGALIVNLAYGIVHGIVGLAGHSWWFIALSGYYIVLGMTRFAAVLCGRKQRDAVSRELERFVLRLTGGLLLLLSCVLAGVNYLSLSEDIATQHGEIWMITIATFTFGKITMAVIRWVKHGKNPSDLLAAIRRITYAEVAVSVLTLQRSMLVSFGEMEPQTRLLMNVLTGTGVYLFILVLGLGMILGRRWGTDGEIKVGRSKQKNR